MSVCLFVCSPTPPRSLGRSSPNLEGRWRAAPDISLRGSFLKGQGHRGQRSNLFCFFFSVCSPTSPRSLGQSSPNLEGRWRAAPDISLRGSFLKGQAHRGQRSNLLFFSVCSPTSPRSLGRSSSNLLGRLRATLDISLRGSFSKGQGHRGQRSNFCIWADLHQIWREGGGRLRILA